MQFFFAVDAESHLLETNAKLQRVQKIAIASNQNIDK